jgi:hypothetical protein
MKKFYTQLKEFSQFIIDLITITQEKITFTKNHKHKVLEILVKKEITILNKIIDAFLNKFGTSNRLFTSTLENRLAFLDGGIAVAIKTLNFELAAKLRVEKRDLRKKPMNKYIKTKIIGLAIIFVLLSCNKNGKTKDISSDSTAVEIDSTAYNSENSNKIAEEKIYFPATELIGLGFKHIDNYLYEGPSLVVDIKLKNDTGNKITMFKMKYFMEILFEDNTILYSPMFYQADTTPADETIWNNGNVLDVAIAEDDIWLPKTERVFHLVNFGTYAPGWYKRNFAKSIFERTPKSVSLLTKYNATSVDGEYSNANKIDLLEYWKAYQAEINLR